VLSRGSLASIVMYLSVQPKLKTE